ncbi:MAG: tetratricopeptide repeat protein, partial [Thermoanaerobaculia bacterium]|nr:tetratricopeptide repeat protein [Thermoanaerobaculia bacterium]
DEELTAVRSELPDRLGRIIDRCLEKDPEQRYRSAAEVLADLERTREEVRGRGDGVGAPFRPFRSIGRRRLAWSLAAFAALVAIVALAVVLGRRATAPEASGSAISSLAVLPLDNLSGDPSQDYFADGMTELLITDLSKIGSLKVISRTSAMQFKGSARPLPEIAEILDVDAVVQGSVLRAGDEVRITAQLIDARADENLWAESYQRRLEDVLGIQAEVARAIARQIEVALTPEEMARLDTERTVDPEALDAYLEGRALWQRWGPYIEQSIPHFLRAIEIDPDYALAHAGLADAYLVLAHFARPAHEAMPLAKQSALRALELDPYLAEAHTSLADSVFHYEWDWERAEEEFERALQLNPGYATAHAWYSGLLAALGRHDEAVRQIEQARELEPLNYGIQAFGVRVLAWAGRHDQALQLATALRERFPEASPEMYAMALAINDRPVPGDILAALERQAESVTLPYPKAALAVTLAGSGQEELARELLDDLESAYRTTYVSPYMIAQARALLGESDAALFWLEEALEGRAADLIWIDVEPAFEPLRGADRFETIVSSMDFPDRGPSS